MEFPRFGGSVPDWLAAGSMNGFANEAGYDTALGAGCDWLIAEAPKPKLEAEIPEVVAGGTKEF